MNTKVATHIGVVINHNYGLPTRCKVELRETAKFWVAVNTGNKYRKSSGMPAGADMWNQRHLELDSIERKPPVVTHVGTSPDGRANRWRVDCPCGNKIIPRTTLLASQQFDCERCETTYVADWNGPTVKELKKC